MDAFTEDSSVPDELSCFTARTDSRGRIVIPSRVRDKLQLEKGEEVDVLVARGGRDV